jgi:hypothetical protein
MKGGPACGGWRETAGDVGKDNRDMRQEGGFLAANGDKQQHAGWTGPSLSVRCVL